MNDLNVPYLIISILVSIAMLATIGYMCWFDTDYKFNYDSVSTQELRERLIKYSENYSNRIYYTDEISRIKESLLRRKKRQLFYIKFHEKVDQFVPLLTTFKPIYERHITTAARRNNKAGKRYNR